jgi:hypothetical protein
MVSTVSSSHVVSPSMLGSLKVVPGAAVRQMPRTQMSAEGHIRCGGVQFVLVKNFYLLKVKLFPIMCY